MVSDDHYDHLVKQLRHATSGQSSVLAEVGAPPTDSTFSLPIWMGSLDKVIGAVVTQKMEKLESNTGIVVSDKLDGISCLYIRHQGREWLVTRGNGSIGQDISHLMQYIERVPRDVLPGGDVLVRGELVIPKARFAAQFSGDYSNMRNLVAGCANSKVVKVEVATAIRFVGYEIPSHSLMINVADQLGVLGDSGVETVTYTVVSARECAYEPLLTSYKDRKAAGEYDIDGLVVAANTTYALVSNDNPKHAFAFKDPSLTESCVVEVVAVTWDVSRLGRLTPVVSFAPVQLSGVTISKATAHNYKFVHDLSIGVGAHITICRSGEVIPKILGVVRTSAVAPPDVPYRVDGPHAYRLDGIDGSKRLHYFLVSLDIKNAGPAACEKLTAAGVVLPADLCALDRDTVTSICGTKSCVDVPADLRSAVLVAPMWQVLSATGAFGPGIGGRILRTIANKYPGRALETLSNEALCAVDGVGPSRAHLITAGIHGALEYVRGMQMTDEGTQATGRGTAPHGSMSGQRVVFTGVRDKELATSVESHGGTIVTSGKNATVLVVASDGFRHSAKSNDAIRAGARVITVDALWTMLA